MRKAKEYLYIYLEQDETRGENQRDGDGTRWSGFRHTVKTIRKLGPARICASSPGWDYQDINSEDVNPIVFEEQPDHLYVVYLDTYSGGTFGGTDGYIVFSYVTTSRTDAEEWLEKNRKDLEKRYKGWGSRLNSIDIDLIHLEK